MYGERKNFGDDLTIVRNEQSFQNLILVANNPKLFGALDQETQHQLVEMIAAYTTACLNGIVKESVRAGDGEVLGEYNRRMGI